MDYFISSRYRITTAAVITNTGTLADSKLKVITLTFFVISPKAIRQVVKKGKIIKHGIAIHSMINIFNFNQARNRPDGDSLCSTNRMKYMRESVVRIRNGSCSASVWMVGESTGDIGGICGFSIVIRSYF
jgi:hypothetical protein